MDGVELVKIVGAKVFGDFFSLCTERCGPNKKRDLHKGLNKQGQIPIDGFLLEVMKWCANGGSISL